MTWRLAKSLEVLRNQVNAQSPSRSKASDGTIGDAAHASRKSDHNPWVKDGPVGVVTAIDVTHDPANGVNSQELAESLIKSRDSRIKYVISNGKIASGPEGPSPWKWRKYSGTNPHSRHVHLSVRADRGQYDLERPWTLNLSEPDTGAQPVRENPILRRGDRGEDVRRLQKLLNDKGAKIKVDGDFGPTTFKKVRQYQEFADLVSDGVVGAYTWERLDG